jgi:hypothetical protein
VSGESRRLLLVVVALAGIFAMHGVQIVCGHMGGHAAFKSVAPASETHVHSAASLAEGAHGATTLTGTAVEPVQRIGPGGSESERTPTGNGAVMGLGLCVAVIGGSALLVGLLLRVCRDTASRPTAVASS